MDDIYKIVYSDKFVNMTNFDLANYCRQNFGIFSDYSEKLFANDSYIKYLSCAFTELKKNDSVKAQYVREEILKRLMNQ